MVLCKDINNKHAINAFKTLAQRFQNIHGNKYNYSKVIYKGASKKVTIICPLHGEFKQTPNSHLRGSGCKLCYYLNKTLDYYKIYNNKTTYLYYIKIDNYYKVGVTKTSVKHRFRKEIKEGIVIEIIREILYNNGLDALECENKILAASAQYNVSKCESPTLGGWTEIRNEDITEIFDKIVKEYEGLI